MATLLTILMVVGVFVGIGWLLLYLQLKEKQEFFEEYKTQLADPLGAVLLPSAVGKTVPTCRFFRDGKRVELGPSVNGDFELRFEYRGAVDLRIVSSLDVVDDTPPDSCMTEDDGRLSSTVREALQKISALARPAEVQTIVSSKWFSVQLIGCDRLAPKSALRFIALGQELFDSFRDSFKLEMEYSDRICAVCGNAIFENFRTCDVCQAHHHPECWTLNDGCGRCRE